MNWKNSAIEEGEGNTSRSKQREGERENLCVFDIFVLPPAMIMQYSKDSV